MNQLTESRYKSKGKLLYRKFTLFLLPSVISAISVALSEFVDGIMVSNLSGEKGLVIITLGSPVMFLISFIYILLGEGGSVLYSTKMGEMKADKANRFFHCAILSAVLIGVVFSIVSFAFHSSITHLLSAGSGYEDELGDYLFYLFLCIPVLIVLMTFIMFLPAFGRPNLGSIGVLIANVTNLALDYVFIGIMDIGIKGAALATLCGHLISAAVIVCVLLFDKKKTSFGRMRLSEFKFLGKDFIQIGKKGISVSVTQLGFLVLTLYCNYTASRYGGAVGIAVLALCLQTESIVSIALGGGCDSVIPIIALLKGQQDYKEINRLAKKVACFVVACVAVLMIIFMAAPNLICAMYGTQSSEIQSGFYHAIRIYAIYYPVRALIILFRNTVNALGKELFALVISLLDGIVGIILFSSLLCPVFGLDGLWMTYPVNAAFTASVIFVVSFITRKRSGLKGVLMLPPVADEELLSLEFVDENDEISDVSKLVESFCLKKCVGQSGAAKAGLLAEEMAVYTRTHRKNIRILIF